MTATTTTGYSVLHGAQQALEFLVAGLDALPDQVRAHARNVNFVSDFGGENIYLPCPFKATEAISAVKALEGCAVAAFADLRFEGVGDALPSSGRVTVDVDKATCFLLSTYLSTVDGMHKTDKNVRAKLKDTDLNQAQSILYRRFSANLYETKTRGKYFHLHGSLEASTALNMIGLPAFAPELTDYREIIDVIESRVKMFTPEELEALNRERGQAGVTCFKNEEFLETDHGKRIFSDPLFTIETLETSSPPPPFPAVSEGRPRQALSGIRVLELCRIIAGPTIGRSLAEYGADVLKITSPKLPDVPFFQVDGNMGKHTASLDLKSPQDRLQFEHLLSTADVLIDGYRPGALSRLGYGPGKLAKLAKQRGKGFVYVSENCFGHVGEWKERPGWQQIADCVCGLAWEQGRWMGVDGPVVPAFPMCDYGTGTIGALSVILSLHTRSLHGGSYHAKTSLLQYNTLLFKLHLYPPTIQHHLQTLWSQTPFMDLRHSDSVDEVSSRALSRMKSLFPTLFTTFRDKFSKTAWSAGFGAVVSVLGPVVAVSGVAVGWGRMTRPNGVDRPEWEGWEWEWLGDCEGN